VNHLEARLPPASPRATPVDDLQAKLAQLTEQQQLALAQLKGMLESLAPALNALEERARAEQELARRDDEVTRREDEVTRREDEVRPLERGLENLRSAALVWPWTRRGCGLPGRTKADCERDLEAAAGSL
jgi:hypothetical protein